jgi:peptide/nickel transport system substrate-binding protein
VRESGTKGAHVTFWSAAPPPIAAASARYERRLFTQLGYRISLKRLTGFNEYYGALGKSPLAQPQAGVNGWFADYPAASNFFSIVSCSTAGDHAVNASRFCSRTFDAQLKHASVLQTHDQDAASKLWAEVDRHATDLAAVVPTHTPRNVDLVSTRVGNYQHNPLFGVLLDQLWVR